MPTVNPLTMEKNSPVQTRSTTPKRCSTRKRRRQITQDIITSLPDAVLLHIFSFLDMKEVVQTSFVTRSWRYLWKFVSDLNFDYTLWKKPSSKRVPTKSNNRPYVKGKYSLQEGMDFVDRVLLFRDNSTTIRKIKLCHLYCKAPGRLHTWLSVAINLHLKEVYIDLGNMRSNYTFPSSLFTSQIEVFKLDAILLRRTGFQASIPDSVLSASHLKKLELNSAKLPGDDKIVWRNPVLESLILTNCRHNLRNMNIIAPHLNKLTIENKDCDDYEYAKCRIEFSAPNLKSVQLFGRYYPDCSFSNSNSLVTAEIGSYTIRSEVGYLKELLNCVHSVSVLGLCVCSLMSESGNILNELVHPFSNLRCLKLIRTYPIGTITKFFESAPSIEMLVVELPREGPLFTVEDWRENVPLQDMLSNLRFVQIRNVRCREEEIELLKLLLKNSNALESVTVFFNWRFSMYYYEKQKMEEFMQKLHSLPKASPIVQVQSCMLSADECYAY